MCQGLQAYQGARARAASSCVNMTSARRSMLTGSVPSFYARRSTPAVFRARPHPTHTRARHSTPAVPCPPFSVPRRPRPRRSAAALTRVSRHAVVSQSASHQGYSSKATQSVSQSASQPCTIVPSQPLSHSASQSASQSVSQQPHTFSSAQSSGVTGRSQCGGAGG